MTICGARAFSRTADVKAVLVFMVLTMWLFEASAQELLRVSATAWSELTPEERTAIQRARMVEIRETGTFGLIVDTQGVNESTPGTTGGASLGGAVAEASYIDHALKPGNGYSAKAQLGATILGALVGSALDAPAVSRFHFRYAVKLSDGEIRMIDVVQANAFRIPAGVCVGLPDLLQISQGACTHTDADLRRLYLSAPTPVTALAPKPASPETSPVPQPHAKPVVTGSAPATVSCRLGSLPPVQTTPEKCKSIGGEAQ